MLARKFKIGSRERVTYILEKGYYRRARFIQCKFLRNRLTHARFSMIVSKKISRTAVGRNRVRRRIYEALRRNWHIVGGKCYDVVVLPSSRIIKAPFGEIEKDIILLLK